MKRLHPIDWALLALLLPLWVTCFALSTRSGLRSTGIPPVYVSAADAGGYPVVAGFRPDVTVGESGLRVGDRLLRLGDTDLRDVGPLGLFVRVAEAAGPDGRIALRVERAGQSKDTSVAVETYAYFVWPLLPVSLAMALTAVLLLLRAPPSPMVRAFFCAFMCTAITHVGVFGGPRAETYASILINTLSMTLVAPLALRALLLFPYDVPPTGKAALFGPWLFAPAGLFAASALYGLPLSPQVGFAGLFAIVAVAFATFLAVMTRAYRVADPIGRRQLKWFMFGLYGGLVPPAAAAAIAAYDPRFTQLPFLALSAQALIPISLLIAVSRYNLFDVDRLFSAAASYNVVLVLLAGIGFVVAPRLSAAMAGTIGLDPTLGQTLVGLVLAAVVVPAHRRLRPELERMFFPERYAVDRGIELLLRELSLCSDVDVLLKCVGGRLHEVLRPESCLLYARVDGTFAPVYAAGRTIPEVLPVDGPLVAALRARRDMLTLSGDGLHDLGPFDRAAFETLAAAVVLPICHRDELAAFVCLGQKRSGDVYTPTDLRLLAAVMDKSSGELLRIEQASANQALERAYADLKSAQVQLVQSEKMASVRKLAAGVAHEINNPLSFIASNIEPLRRRLDRAARVPPEEAARLLGQAQELVGIMAKGAERTGSIVKDLGSFSRLNEADLKAVDLREGLDASIQLIEADWRDRIAVHREYHVLPHVECEAFQINQVFMNLLANACEAIEGKGDIWVVARCDGEMVAISIRDNGRGIPAEHLELIVDPFFTTKEVGRGTGLGLAIAHGVVTRNGGRLEVESTLGVGTTMTVVLPMDARAQTPPNEQPRS